MSTKEKNEIVPDDPTQAAEKRLESAENMHLQIATSGFHTFFIPSDTDQKVFGELTCFFFHFLKQDLSHL